MSRSKEWHLLTLARFYFHFLRLLLGPLSFAEGDQSQSSPARKTTNKIKHVCFYFHRERLVCSAIKFWNYIRPESCIATVKWFKNLIRYALGSPTLSFDKVMTDSRLSTYWKAVMVHQSVSKVFRRHSLPPTFEIIILKFVRFSTDSTFSNMFQYLFVQGNCLILGLFSRHLEYIILWL